MGDACQPLEEGLVAKVAVQAADKSAIDFQVVEAQVVQQADLAELPAEVLDADPAAGHLQIADKPAEGVELPERSGLGDLKPESCGNLGLLT